MAIDEIIDVEDFDKENPEAFAALVRAALIYRKKEDRQRAIDVIQSLCHGSILEGYEREGQLYLKILDGEKQKEVRIGDTPETIEGEPVVVHKYFNCHAFFGDYKLNNSTQ